MALTRAAKLAAARAPNGPTHPPHTPANAQRQKHRSQPRRRQPNHCSHLYDIPATTPNRTPLLRSAHRCYTRCPLLLCTLPDPPAPTADTAADNAAHKPAAGPRGHAVGPIFNRLGRWWTTTAPNRPQRESASTHSLTPAQGRPQTAYLASTALKSTAIATTAKTTAIATHTRARHHRPSQK